MKSLVAAEIDQWQIASAGTWAAEGEPAAPRTREVLKKRGIDLANHQSQQITGELAAGFNLLLVMESGHREALRAEFPALRSRIYQLSELSGRRFDIRDPYGSALVDYEDTAREIQGLLTGGLAEIRRLAGPPAGPTSGEAAG